MGSGDARRVPDWPLDSGRFSLAALACASHLPTQGQPFQQNISDKQKKNPKLSESLITYPLRGIHLIGKAILRLCNLFLCDMYTMTQSNKYAHYKVALTSDISNGTRVLSQLRLGAGIALRSFLAIGSVFGQRRYSDWTWSSCCRWYIFRSEPWCQHLYLLSLASYRELLLRWCLIA